MLLPLSRRYAATGGVPVVHHVDSGIFLSRYFARCLACDFCHDSCCQYGVDVGSAEVARILERADAIERLVGVPRGEWFEPEFEEDPQMPGGRVTRTRVVDGGCVFRAREGRGCLLHRHAIEAGEDYHAIKPLVSALFPVSFDDGAFVLADEILEGSLVCAGEGATVYDAARPELLHYFGAECVAELDGIRERMRSGREQGTGNGEQG